MNAAGGAGRSGGGQGQRAIGVGVIGLGYMGWTHVASYRAAEKAGRANRLVAVCDQDAANLRGRASPAGNVETPATGASRDLRGVETTGSPEELLRNDAVELVSICTHTETHVALALAALEAGKHVLVEKPVALTSAAARTLADAARGSGKLCMPAMCMRFWPGWTWLKETIESGALGPVKSAVFRRLSSPPRWSRDFYGDRSRSGGALFDLHVHDADFVLHCFGSPAEVTSAGSPDHVTSCYRFEHGPAHVSAEGGWDHADGFPFHMGYTVVFERGTADYAVSRTPQLLLAREGKSEPVALAPETGYEAEIRHALAAVAGEEALVAPIEQAVLVIALLEAERESLRTGAPVRV